MLLLRVDFTGNPLEYGALAALISGMVYVIIWLNGQLKTKRTEYLEVIASKEKETSAVREKYEKEIKEVREKHEKEMESVREKLEKSESQKLEMTHRVVELSVELLAAIKRFNNGHINH